VVRTIFETRSLLKEAMSEVLAVARAHSAGVSDDTVNQSLASLDRAPAAAIGNLRDILDGRPSELETEVGAVVRLARTAEVDVPRREFLYACLLPQEQKARGQIKFPANEQEASKAA
jgi:2-dehydropantoate 2-reductase